MPAPARSIPGHRSFPPLFACRWEASTKAIRNVDFSPAHSDGVLFSCDEGGACKLWSVDNGEEIAQLAAPPGGSALWGTDTAGRSGSAGWQATHAPGANPSCGAEAEPDGARARRPGDNAERGAGMSRAECVHHRLMRHAFPP